jgi:hypothetical protein
MLREFQLEELKIESFEGGKALSIQKLLFLVRITCKNLQVHETNQISLPCKRRRPKTWTSTSMLWRHANSGRNRIGNIITYTKQRLLTSSNLNVTFYISLLLYYSQAHIFSKILSQDFFFFFLHASVRIKEINISVLEKNQQYALIVPPLYSTCWLLHVSAVVCHHQGAYWILLSYVKYKRRGGISYNVWLRGLCAGLSWFMEHVGANT